MSTEQEHKKTFKEILIKNFKGVQRGTDFILKTVPKDKLDYSPGSEMRKLGELAFHVSTLPFTFIYNVEKQFKERPSPDEFKKVIGEKFGPDLAKNNYPAIFASSCEYFLNFFEKHSNEEIVQQTFTNFLFQNPTPLLSAFLSVEDHLIQHRGTIFAYLRLLRVPVTMKQYFGMEELH